MNAPFVLVQRDAAIVTVIMNDPETRNALSRTEQCDEMVDALEAVNRDPDVKVVVVTGTGSAFCAGGNIKDMSTKQGFMAGRPDEIGERYRHSLQRLARTLYGLEVPTIAAVNGPAMGAGLDLACMCDMRIASERARFSETFVRLGLISGIGGAWFLPRAIGHARAAEMAFSGRIIDADTALAYGLVTEVLPAEALRERAAGLAAEIAANSGVALRYAKRLLRLSERSELTATLDATAALQTIAHLTEEHRVSVERYLEEQRVRRGASR
jgi:enoyl-CoA hydratase/carnithine racemase